MWKEHGSIASLLAVVSLAATGAVDAAGGAQPNVSGLRIDQPFAASRGPVGVAGRTADYVVTLSAPSVAKAYKDAGRLSRDAQRVHARGLKADQDKVADRVRQLGGKEVARVTKALNGLVVSVDARQARELEQMDGVLSVRPLNQYQLDLSETVPYIGAAAVQASGNNGAGIRVAVLDSGIDYTHVAFGGAGTDAAYANAYGTTTADPRNTTLDFYFPTAKVVGGYDFVGEAWTGASGSPPLAPDPDPIDCSPSAIGCGGGHGTHVADIIAGVTSGHVGVAPGALLYAVKVCSSISTSCSGVALLQGVDFALDPDGDGDISDHVDVINLSLGSSYGQDEDDLTAALNNASDAGVVVVASAGNAADRPYIVGSPSSGRNIISVAQTQVPSAELFLITAGAVTAGGSWQPWSGLPVFVSGPLQYGDGAAGNLNGCAAFTAGSLTGKVLLVDRGTCAISIKVSNGAGGGALSVVVANNAAQAPGDLPPDFSFGGGTPSVPGYSITRADGNALKTVLGMTATIDPASAASLVGNMVSSSSRGPSVSRNSIKPDIGAPGASVSAEVGTGIGTTAFGGTSGAAPMVSGSAALLLKARPGASPAEVKSLMMNTGETNIGLNPVGLPGVLAPITRIGGGEIRINKAVASKTAAWDKKDEAGSLSFGYYPIAKKTKVTRTVVVHNYGNGDRNYTIAPSFRYGNDAASGAVTFKAPPSIQVKGGKSKEFDVEITIDPSRLPFWNLDGGPSGGSGNLLQGVEFDGYLTINGGTNNTVRLAWQVLPHRAADVAASGKKINLKKDGTGSLKLKNKSDVLDGDFDVFALTGQSDQIKKKFLPQPGDNFAVVDLKSVGVRVVDDVVQFGIDTYWARAHPNYPAEFDIYVDSNNDGVPDYVVWNLENGGFGATGQNVVAVANLTTGAASVFFYIDADLNSGNAILTAPLAALGLTPSSTFTFSVYAFDNYFTGNLTDSIENMTFTGDTPRFAASTIGDTVPAGGEFVLDVAAVPAGAAKSPAQTGFLVMYRNAEGKSRKDVGKDEAEAIEVKP